MKKNFIILLIIIAPLGACRTNMLTNFKVAGAYNTDADFAKLQYVVYHISDATTRIYLRIGTDGLLYNREIGEKNFSARFSLHYEICNVDNPKMITDSMSFLYSDSGNYQKRFPIFDSIDISMSFPGKYFLHLKISDLNRKTSFSNYIYISKETYSSRQNYIIIDKKNHPVFNSYIELGDSNRILTRNTQYPRLFVKYYSREYPIALPPFVEAKNNSFSFSPDSVFFIEMNSGESSILNFRNKGIYHIQADTTTTREGITIFRFYKNFPHISTAEQMLSSLRYITSKSEFNDMMMMKNTKEAVDNFWLDKSGNPDRAKEMIRRYYNRVVEANKYFTSYHEGWKTDRGLIYIIYGQPNLVYRNPSNETWIFGEDRNLLSITFVFQKIDNPFTDNDYELNRSQEYKETWYSVLEGWRN